MIIEEIKKDFGEIKDYIKLKDLTDDQQFHEAQLRFMQRSDSGPFSDVESPMREKMGALLSCGNSIIQQEESRENVRNILQFSNQDDTSGLVSNQ